MTKAPLIPPVRAPDDPEYATNLRRATLVLDAAREKVLAPR